MSTILSTVRSSKLDVMRCWPHLNSYWRIPTIELCSAPIISKTLFGNKIKEVAKRKFEAQQQRFLATSSAATNIQQQRKVTYPAPPVFKRPKQPIKPSRPK